MDENTPAETGGFSRLELEDAGAVEVFAEPRDLLEHLETSRIGALGALVADGRAQ